MVSDNGSVSDCPGWSVMGPGVPTVRPPVAAEWNVTDSGTFPTECRLTATVDEKPGAISATGGSPEISSPLTSGITNLGVTEPVMAGSVVLMAVTVNEA